MTGLQLEKPRVRSVKKFLNEHPQASLLAKNNPLIVGELARWFKEKRAIKTEESVINAFITMLRHEQDAMELYTKLAKSHRQTAIEANRWLRSTHKRATFQHRLNVLKKFLHSSPKKNP